MDIDNLHPLLPLHSLYNILYNCTAVFIPHQDLFYLPQQEILPL